ncbi:flagellar basal body-associated FliL family protein [Metallumcola ferriviriculae]|uniref:Flagellar protein FliL n=1 Tax=Metallumcola ferriviriculae TaxID=3039180 RepID=A0AAU0USR0_9FIRM|nr:flagellar basal body-associated FliL family protein [Desulfitibacteraceae bacterium MK1]
MSQKGKEETEANGKIFTLKRIVLGVLLLAFIFAAMAAQTYYITSRQNSNSDGKPSKVTEELMKYELEPFTVNLHDLNFRRFLRATITVEYTSKDTGKELEEKGHRIRDQIITILQSKDIASLNNSDKVATLREELTSAINSLLNNDIKGIYFQDFIIQ